MPGVLKTDCRVKPEVKSFTRLETKLAGSFHFCYRATLILQIKTRLRWNLHVQAGEMSPQRRAHDLPLGTRTYFSRGAWFASYSGPVR